MNINAYILAADPAWIEASVLSYYDVVGRIVVSFDVDSRGWTGAPIDVVQCLRRLRAIDRLGKLDFRPGHYARSKYFSQPMVSETFQRQCALEQAGDGADWILQLDTDEVLGDASTLFGCINIAQQASRAALNYPAIWLYSHAYGRWYLEWCRRGWRRQTGYPGPIAVRAGAVLSHARRLLGPNEAYFHADISRRPSAVAFPARSASDFVVQPSKAIYHLSWVRSERWLRRKFSTWGHACDKDWHPEVARWLKATSHPMWASIKSQFERGNEKRPLRLARIPENVARFIECSADDDGASLLSKNRSVEEMVVS